MRKMRTFLSVFSLMLLLFAVQAQGTNCGNAVPVTPSSPFFEGFENGLMPDCWTQSGDGAWSVGTGDYSTSTGAHTGSYNVKITHQNDFDVTKLITPILDLTGLNVVELSFWYINRDWFNATDEVRVFYRTSATGAWQSVFETTENHETWTAASFVLPNTAVQIAFEMTDNWGYGVALDDITIGEAPSCLPVTNLTATATINSVTLRWTDAYNSDANYAVYNMTTNSLISSGSSTTRTIPGLDPATTYTFGVKALCSATEESTVETIIVQTACEAFETSFSEGFESGSMPACWTTEGPLTWMVGTGDGSPSVGAHSGSFNVLIVGYDTGESTKLISPVFNLSTATSLQLNFWYINRKWGQDIDELRVYYRTSINGAWQQIFEATDAHSTWTEAVLTLPNTAVQVAFEMTDFWAYGVALDDIYIGPQTSCAPVTNLTATSTINTVTLNWTDNNNTGATYTILNMVDNVSGIPEELNYSGNTYTVTGLTPSTSYTFAVSADCPDVPVISMPVFVTVQTSCGAIPMPYSEDFNSLTNGIPACWDNSEGTTVNSLYKWNYYSTGYSGAGLRFNSFANSTGKTNILATPPVTITENAQLSFWCKNPTGGDFSVMASVDENPTRYTLISNLIGIRDWFQVVIPLDSVTYTGHNVTFYFQGTSNCGFNDAFIYLDDVSIEAQSAPTACSVTLPYSYDFESIADMSCWTVISDQSGTGRTRGNITYNTSSGSYLFNFEAGTTAQMLISPELRNTSNGVMVSFAFSQTYGTDYFEVGYSFTSTSLSSFTWVEAEDNGSQTVQYYSHTFPAGTKYIAIRYNPMYQYGLSIDDFSFEEPPTCQPVTYLQGSYSYNSMTLTWQDYRNSGVTYTVYDMSDNSVIISGLTDWTYTVTGLMDRTSYTFGVAANCSDTEESEIVTHTHRTRCAPFTIPYLDDMGSGDYIECWSRTQNANTNNFTEFISYEGHSVLAFGSFNQAEYGVTNYNQYAYSPLINSGVENGNIHLRVVYSTYGSSDPLYFGYSTTVSDNPGSYTWSGPFYTNGYDDWATYTADIPANIVQLAIRYAPAGRNNRAFVDLIELTGDCSPMPIPYTEDFESCEAVSYTASANAMPMPACWDQFAPASPSTGLMCTPHVYNSTNYTHAHSGTNSLMIVGGSNNAGDAESYALLPQMSVPLYLLQMNFWLTTMTEYSGTLVVGYVTGNDYTTFNALQSYPASSQTVHTEGGYGFTLNLSAVPASATRLAFKWMEDEGRTLGCFIDDITIDYPPVTPTCDILQNPGIVDSWSDQIDLYWEDPNGGTNYTLLQFNPEASSPFTALATNLVADLEGHVTHTVTGLTPNTQYDFLVVGQCSPNGPDTLGIQVSTAAASLSLVTVCEDYVWHNTLYEATGEYYSRNDTLRLTVMGITRSDTTVCTRESSYTWYGTTYIESGEYTYTTYDSETGCDKVVTLHLTLGSNCCMPVTNLVVDSISETTVSLSWNGTAANYTVMNGTTQVVTGITDTHYTVTGLTAATHYTFSVIANCTATESSTESMINVTTDCGVESVPYFEGFEGYDAVDYFGSVDLNWLPQPLPICWEGTITTDVNNDTTYTDGFGMTFSYKPHVVAGAGSVFWNGGSQSLEMVAASNSSTYALLPQLNTPLNQLKMEFWMGTNYYATTKGILTVGYVTNDSVNTFTAVQGFPASVTTQVSYSPSPGGKNVTINLSDVPDEATRLAFKWENTVDNTTAMLEHPLCFIDDINITVIDNCSDITIPYIENFEADGLYNCWTVHANSEYTHCWDIPSMPLNGASCFVFGNSSNPPQYLISPELTGTGTGLQMSFSYKALMSNFHESFMVGYSTTTNDTAAFVWSTEVTDITSMTYDRYVENMNTSGIKYVAVKYTARDMSALLIDSLVLREIPVCPPVTNLAVDSVGTNTISLSWNGTAASYTLMNGSAVVATNITGNHYTVSGLTTATHYIFSLIANCSATENSGPVHVSATTDCEAITRLPYMQNFDSDAHCWTLIDADGDGYNWRLMNGAVHSASYDNNAGPLHPDNWLVTPRFVLPADGNYEVSWSAAPQDLLWPSEHYGLYVSTTGNADTADFVLLQEWTLSSSDNPAIPVVDLSAYAGQSIYLAFRHWNCVDWYRIAIDDFIIREQAGANQVVITVTRNNPMYGNVTGGGTYNIGDSVTVTATPVEGYQFQKWVNLDNQEVSTANPYSFVATADTTLQAIFIYATANPVEVVVLPNNPAMGSVTGSGSYVLGSVATLTATANPGYHFVNWEIYGNALSTTTPFNITVTDDVDTIYAIFEADICHSVSNLDVDSISETTISLSWNGSAESYRIYNLANSSIVATVTETHYTVTGLEPGTLYTFGVRAFCLSSDSSLLSVITMNTSCAPVTALPYIQRFDTYPACWTLFDMDGDLNIWTWDNGTMTSASYGNNVALNPDNWLISPQLNLPAGNNYEVTWDAAPVDITYPSEHYGLYVSTTGNADPADFALLQEWTLTANDNPATPVVDLSAYAGQRIYLAFRHWNCTNMFSIAIDNFIVREPVVHHDCYPLTNLRCTDTTATSVTLQWDDPDNSEVIYKIVCTDETLATTVIDSITSTSYVVTDLTPNTVYMFMVFPVCGDTMAEGGSVVVKTLQQTSIASVEVTSKWNLYPNPANTVVTVKAEGMRRVTIFDATGRKVENREVNGDMERFDVTGLDNGVYFFRIETADHMAVRKCVISH